MALPQCNVLTVEAGRGCGLVMTHHEGLCLGGADIFLLCEEDELVEVFILGKNGYLIFIVFAAECLAAVVFKRFETLSRERYICGVVVQLDCNAAFGIVDSHALYNDAAKAGYSGHIVCDDLVDGVLAHAGCG